jgi:glycosyltransferase involved in cell wall biosynthesis
MKISVLVPDISSNAMARTCPISKVLERDHEVEIIGFDSGGGFYEPWEGKFTTKTVETGYTPHGLWKGVREASEAISGDLLYAFRPCAGSFGVGLYHKRTHNKPLLLDIEDLIRFQEFPFYKQGYQMVRYSNRPESEFYSELLRRVTNKANEVTVTSSVIAEKYDGVRVPYGPNETEFSPDKVSIPDIDEPLPGDYQVIFAGTIRKHKGLDDLARAISMCNHDVRLLVLGYDPANLLPQIDSLSDGKTEYLGTVPHDAVPGYLKLADFVALPQKRTRYTAAQIPEKVFEAMAMKKPIVASAVSDLPEILDGCGRIVEPESPDLLAAEINSILDNPDEATAMGERARERYVSRYGWNQMQQDLDSIIDRVTAN